MYTVWETMCTKMYMILQRDLYIVQLSRTTMRSKGKCPLLRINLLYELCATIVFRALTLWYQAKAKREMGGGEGGGYPANLYPTDKWVFTGGYNA